MAAPTAAPTSTVRSKPNLITGGVGDVDEKYR